MAWGLEKQTPMVKEKAAQPRFHLRGQLLFP
jgi:hypothetical protein